MIGMTYDAAEARNGLFDKVTNRCFRAHIAFQSAEPLPDSKGRAQQMQCRNIPVHSDDRCISGKQQPDGGGADRAGGAGHQCNFACELLLICHEPHSQGLLTGQGILKPELYSGSILSPIVAGKQRYRSTRSRSVDHA